MAGLAGIHELLGVVVVVAFVVVAILAAVAAAGRDMRWVRTASFVAAGLLALQYLLGLLLLGNGFRNSTTHYVVGLLVLVPVVLQHTSGRGLSEKVHGVALMIWSLAAAFLGVIAYLTGMWGVAGAAP